MWWVDPLGDFWAYRRLEAAGLERPAWVSVCTPTCVDSTRTKAEAFPLLPSPIPETLPLQLQLFFPFACPRRVMSGSSHWGRWRGAQAAAGIVGLSTEVWGCRLMEGGCSQKRASD